MSDYSVYNGSSGIDKAEADRFAWLREEPAGRIDPRDMVLLQWAYLVSFVAAVAVWVAVMLGY